LSNKDFKVKNKLQVAGITSAGPLVSDASGNVDSTSSIATQYGGTGTTTSPTSGQILYSSSGTTYAPTDLTSVVTIFTNTELSSNVTLAKNTNYFVDTTAARTLTLPASPSTGDQIYIFDASNNALTNNITVLPNSNKVQGSVQNLIIDSNAATVALTYTGSSYGWAVN
jgi:hypothetical protein